MKPWGRRAANPLGDGVWRRAHDRFRRAVDRYHQLLEHVPAGDARDRLEEAGAELARHLDQVRGVCERAQELAPSSGDHVPGGHGGALLDVHRAVARAAALAAQAAEAVALAAVTARDGDPTGASSHTSAATRASNQAGKQIEDATSILRAIPPV